MLEMRRYDCQGEKDMSQVYPHPCTNCGYCCLITECPVELEVFGKRAPGKMCPAFSIKDGVSSCAMVEKLGAEKMGAGVGCCIKATVYNQYGAFDFAALPEDVK